MSNKCVLLGSVGISQQSFRKGAVEEKRFRDAKCRGANFNALKYFPEIRSEKCKRLRINMRTVEQNNTAMFFGNENNDVGRNYIL